MKKLLLSVVLLSSVGLAWATLAEACDTYGNACPNGICAGNPGGLVCLQTNMTQCQSNTSCFTGCCLRPGANSQWNNKVPLCVDAAWCGATPATPAIHF